MSEMFQQPAEIAAVGESSGADIRPGELRVIKRTGEIVTYDESKVYNAIFGAYLSVQGESMRHSAAAQQKVRDLVEQVSAIFRRRLVSGGAIHIEEIQDQVELALMRDAEHQVARAYVLYREERNRERLARQSAQASTPVVEFRGIQVLEPDGSSSILNVEELRTICQLATRDLDDVDSEQIFRDAHNSLYDGVKRTEIGEALKLAARAMVEQEPNYSQVAARLLNFYTHMEVLQTLGLDTARLVDAFGDDRKMQALYAEVLPLYLQMGISLGYLDPRLKESDFHALADVLDPARDRQFTYLGLQTLYDRYLLHNDKKRYELPQVFFLRVAAGLAVNEPQAQRRQRTVEYYNLLSSFDYMSSTPTLFNSGTTRPQLSSCYLTTVPDDLEGIFGAVQENAMLSKWAGGLGNDWTPVRAMGTHIQGTNGQSQGIVPFLKIVNDTAVAVNQGGKRKGAVCCYLETWHLDIEEFLQLRKNTGDDRRRTHDMHTANWVPDLFMKRVMEKGDWTLFSPPEVPELHDLTGVAFEERYEEYERLADLGSIANFKRIKAEALWRQMLNMVFETGHPWITFKDACNLRSPQQHCGSIHSSNLCTEITLNTSDEEIAVCNLGSINLPNHITDGNLDLPRLHKTVRTAVRMLDNVIDINYYAVEKARRSNLRHRPVGLGLMGFQDALYQMNIPYASDQAVAFADSSMEYIAYTAIEASAELAQERGSYESFAGSLWSKGTLPLDSLKLLSEQRGADYLQADFSATLDWESLRQKVRQGMRNSNVMAIAPTATISNIVGVSQSIEPTYQNLYTKSNLSGEFTVINTYLVKELKDLGLWDDAMRADLKHYDGSVQDIERIPAHLRKLFATAFQVPPKWLVDAAARRQKWLDQSQSLNIYMADVDGKKLDITYKMCWLRGLKTTYYLRSLGATAIEKASGRGGTLNAVQKSDQPAVAAVPATQPAGQACSLDDPDCEACQ